MQPSCGVIPPSSANLPRSTPYPYPRKVLCTQEDRDSSLMKKKRPEASCSRRHRHHPHHRGHDRRHERGHPRREHRREQRRKHPHRRLDVPAPARPAALKHTETEEEKHKGRVRGEHKCDRARVAPGLVADGKSRVARQDGEANLG
uniref:Uncharacterized protein n=1 Tax=Arundo donax TaxID=35708 RepID=A0A0A9FBI8_ARUDO